MAQLILGPLAKGDLQRILKHLLDHQASHIAERMTALMSAIDILQLHPDIGRSAPDGLRELVIGRGAQGYIALYQHDRLTGRVIVLTVRAQRESPKAFAAAIAIARAKRSRRT